MLDRLELREEIKEAYLETRNPNRDYNESLDIFCDKLSTAITKHIKTLEINYTAGLTAPNGPVTGTLNHTVS